MSRFDATSLNKVNKSSPSIKLTNGYEIDQNLLSLQMSQGNIINHLMIFVTEIRVRVVGSTDQIEHVEMGRLASS